MPTVQANEVASARLRHGQRIRMGDGITCDQKYVAEHPVLVLEPDGTALAVAEICTDNVLRVQRVFAPIKS